MNPSLCPHITDDNTPFTGLPDASNNPRFYCSLCTVERVAALTAIMQPAAIFRMMFVEPKFAREITAAMRTFTYELKQSSPENSLIRNRVQCVARYIANAAGLGHSKQERFQRYKFNQDDNRGPSYRRSVIVPRLKEPKALSKFCDVVAYNRVIDAAV